VADLHQNCRPFSRGTGGRFHQNLDHSSIIVFNVYIVEEFDSNLHIAIIMDDKLIQNHLIG